MFLDCCYEGDNKPQQLISEDLQELTGTEEAMDLFKDLGNIFDNLNTMTGPNPVLFSCEPGNSVITELYDFGKGREEIAPLCRRIHIIFEEKLSDEDISVGDLIIMLKYEGLDNRTLPAFTTWSFDEKNLNLLKQK